MERFADKLRAGLLERGASLLGYADMAGVKNAALPYGVAIAIALPPDVVREITDGPTARYYEAYNTINKQLEELRDFAAEEIRAAGYTAEAQAATIKVTSGDVGEAPLPHKTVATRAGLGWVGKSSLLVTPQYGGAVRLISLLTDMPLPTAQPVEESRCGACDVCVRLCPGKVPTGATWRPGMKREQLFRAEACRDTARTLAKKNFGVNATICGKCFVVCPHTQKYLWAAGK